MNDCFVRMADTDTGEILYEACKPSYIFSTQGGKRYLKLVIDSLFRGLRGGRNLSLQIDFKKFPVEDDVFEMNVVDNGVF